ncbi:MAG: tetratricopeptide repeat protein [Bacteroidia bacterium]|nr:tetratricopeptide repeat protein [Bacteroidia bacterium]
MRTLLLAILLSISSTILCQDISKDIRQLFEQKRYQEIINRYSSQYKTLPYDALFDFGLAYYKLGNDKSTLEIMEECIRQRDNDSGSYYIKGKSLNFLGQYSKATKAFEQAIKVDGGNGSYYTGLGDAYMSMSQLDKALEAYQKATEHTDSPERPYTKIPLILSAMGKPKPALEAYYIAKDKVERGSDIYLSIIYNIGLFELMNSDYFEAKIALEELISLDVSYFRAYPILIQTYMGLRKFDKILPLKEKLYQAHDQGLLKYIMNDRFCIDQFVWNEGTMIKAYERFQSDKNSTYFKHVYEVQENNIPSFSVQTKHVPSSGLPYKLRMTKGDIEYKFAKAFPKKYDYSEIKLAVMDVISDKLSPTE